GAVFHRKTTTAAAPAWPLERPARPPAALVGHHERELGHGLWVRAFRTHHPIASLGYLFFRRVQKLAAAYRGLPGDELARLRAENRPGVFETHDRLELAYATDTLSDVLDTAPEILEARVLVLECTFLDATRDVARARERSHLHLDELLARAERVRCEAVVLMHFSQSYPPAEVHALLAQRLPPSLAGRVQAFAPASGNWFG
ncbi:MAG: MBL fold metallo-hydrolase, partial [Myxococcales bacterium]